MAANRWIIWVCPECDRWYGDYAYAQHDGNWRCANEHPVTELQQVEVVPVFGEREERLREALNNVRGNVLSMRPVLPKHMQEFADRTVAVADAALASSPSPPDLDGAECHELYSMWLAHHDGVDPDHPLVTAGEKLARRMDPEHPRFKAPPPRGET